MGDKRVLKSNARLWQELQSELLNLRIACEQWELQNFEQSTVIAKCLRVLLYDHGTSRSLFSQLNLKGHSFFATPELVAIDNAKRPGAILANFTATKWIGPNSADSGLIARWIPQYYSAGGRDRDDRSTRILSRKLPFIEWWNEDVLWNSSHRMTREDIVLALCNELGGTHSAAMLSPKAAELLANSQTIGKATAVSIGGHPVIPWNTNYDAVVRQIAYELQETVKRNFQKKVENVSVVPPLPEGWWAAEDRIRTRLNHEYVQSVLLDLERNGEEDSLMAEDIRSEDYWHQYRESLRKRGIS